MKESIFSFLFPKKETSKPEFVYTNITFRYNRKGFGRPIAYRDDGKVFIIDYNSPFEVKPGETWRCRVLEDMENKIIVDPVKLITFEDETVMF